MIKKTLPSKQKGFALLYAIIIVNVLLALVVSITSIAVRERQLGRLDQNSIGAYYAAESGVDCAMYWDLSTSTSAFGAATTSATCNGVPFSATSTGSGSYRYQLGFAYPSSSSLGSVLIKCGYGIL